MHAANVLRDVRKTGYFVFTKAPKVQSNKNNKTAPMNYMFQSNVNGLQEKKTQWRGILLTEQTKQPRVSRMPFMMWIGFVLVSMQLS